MKKRLFGIILCASLLLSSMNVFAGSAIKWFDKNIAYLTASNGYITASTDVVESGIPKIHLKILGTDTYPMQVYNYSSYVREPAPSGCTGAESYHYVGSSSAYLTATYS